MKPPVAGMPNDGVFMIASMPKRREDFNRNMTAMSAVLEALADRARTD